MGLVISADEDEPVPRKIALVLTCDGDHGLFPPPLWLMEGYWFPTLHAAAMQAGWLERDGGAAGRLWLCSECSGKKRVAAR